MSYSFNHNRHHHGNQTNHHFLLLVITPLILFAHQVHASLTVDSTIDKDALAMKLLPVAGTGAVLSNVQFKGDTRCKGLFSGGQSVVSGLNPAFPDQGVVLGTGIVTNLPTQSSTSQTSLFATAGDSDLDTLLPGSSSTQDACVLEFDFECSGNSNADIIAFNYVFGSDEYEEFANSDFNDVFGLFVNGKNIALLPETSTAVTINNVNHVNNNQFYVNNEINNVIYSGIEMDGFTTTLTAVGEAISGKNTIKIAIGDVGDQELDSWILLESGSLTCATRSPTRSPVDSPSEEPSSMPSCSTSPSSAPTSSKGKGKSKKASNHHLRTLGKQGRKGAPTVSPFLPCPAVPSSAPSKLPSNLPSVSLYPTVSKGKGKSSKASLRL